MNTKGFWDLTWLLSGGGSKDSQLSGNSVVSDLYQQRTVSVDGTSRDDLHKH